MKTTVIALALCLATTPAVAQNNTNETQLVGFVGGFCAGVVIGLATGTAIIVLYRCATRPRELTQNPSSRPDWTLPPEFPPTTNAPASTNMVKLLIDAGEAMPLYDIASLNVLDRNSGDLFTNAFSYSVQMSEDGQTWSILYRLYGWVSRSSRLVVATDYDWHPLATNYVFGTTNTLNLPVPLGERGYFRLVAP